MDYAYHDYEHTLYRIRKNRTILYFSVIFRMIGLDYLLFYAKMNIVHLKG